jgi:hypothetical protein
VEDVTLKHEMGIELAHLQGSSALYQNSRSHGNCRPYLRSEIVEGVLRTQSSSRSYLGFSDGESENGILDILVRMLHIQLVRRCHNR